MLSASDDPAVLYHV